MFRSFGDFFEEYTIGSQRQRIERNAVTPCEQGHCVFLRELGLSVLKGFD